MTSIDKTTLPKVLAIVGPTASGKTETVLRLAKKLNLDVISADSRQVYKKMDIGTAKPRGEWEWHANWNGLRHSYFVEGVPHHLVDFLDPGKRFTVAEFRDKATKYIKLAYKNEKIPVISGGTGLYVSSLVDNFKIPRIQPNTKLRSSLEEKSNEQLMHLLNHMDPITAEKIDKYNKRRIIRALEVCILSGEPFSAHRKKGEQMFDFLLIGIDIDKEVLHERIDKRVESMIKEGLIEEITGLLKQSYSWKLPSMSGVGYRQFKGYFDKELNKEECIRLLKRDTRRYARRQLTWFKKDKRIEWYSDYDKIEDRVMEFLGKKNTDN